MRLARRAEFDLDTEMDMQSASAGEPAPATIGEWCGLVDLGQTEQACVELARLRLAALRHGQLHVVQANRSEWSPGSAERSGHW